MVAGGQDHLLLDVRPRVQFAVCALDGAVNIPLAELEVRATRLPTDRFAVEIGLCLSAARKSARPVC